MAARLRDDGRMLSVKLVRQSDYRKVLADVKNPPKPSAELIELMARSKAYKIIG